MLNRIKTGELLKIGILPMGANTGALNDSNVSRNHRLALMKKAELTSVTAGAPCGAAISVTKHANSFAQASENQSLGTLALWAEAS